jgi:hypothetical protein
MKNAWRAGAALLGALALAGCHGDGEVRLFRDRTMRDTVWVKKLDPREFMAKEQELQVSLKVAVFGGKLGELSRSAAVARRVQSKWDASRQTWLARYVLLANEVNSGHVTYEEYQRWQRRMDGMYEAMAKAKAEMAPVVRRMTETAADLAQKELEAELAKQKREAVEKDQTALLKQVENISDETRRVVLGQ